MTANSRSRTPPKGWRLHEQRGTCHDTTHSFHQQGDISRAMNHLLPILAPSWPHIPFRHVFIGLGSEIVRISAPDLGTQALNDLWRVE